MNTITMSVRELLQTWDVGEDVIENFAKQKLPYQIKLLCQLVPPKGRLNKRQKFSTIECIESLIVNVKTPGDIQKKIDEIATDASGKRKTVQPYIMQCTTADEDKFYLIIDKVRNIGATDNVTVAICAFGEGWHNYHHVFPWDYKAAELGNYSTNFSTALIDLAAKHGLAYDLKTVSAEMIKNRVTRTGDGSHPWAQKEKEADDHHHPENPVWGWDDQDMPAEDKVLAEISHRKTE